MSTAAQKRRRYGPVVAWALIGACAIFIASASSRQPALVGDDPSSRITVEVTRTDPSDSILNAIVTVRNGSSVALKSVSLDCTLFDKVGNSLDVAGPFFDNIGAGETAHKTIFLSNVASWSNARCRVVRAE